MKDKKKEMKMWDIINGKKVEETSSDEAEEEEEESEPEQVEKEIPQKKTKKASDEPILKQVNGNALDDTKDGLLNKVYQVDMGSDEDGEEGDNIEQLYEDVQRIKKSTK